MSDDATDNDILNAYKRRLRQLEEQHAKFGYHTPPHIKNEIEDIKREIAEHPGNMAASALPSPPQPDLVHPYTLQANFTGRVSERMLLTEWLSDGAEPILALIALGGTGKSALAWAWVQRAVLGLPLPGTVDEASKVSTSCRLPNEAQPEGVLWWSFSDDQPSFATFLDEAISYATDRNLALQDKSSTYDKVRVLLDLLQKRQLLLVLDDFEQKHPACADLNAMYFLRAAATLPLKSRILLTCRLFPHELDDLAGCRRVDLMDLTPDDAVTFFQSQGICGSYSEIYEVCWLYGYHALALRLLAGVIKNDLRTPGDIKVAQRRRVIDLLKGQTDFQFLRLAYEAMGESNRQLLSRIATFPNSMIYKDIEIFDESGNEKAFIEALTELEERGLLQFDHKHGLFDLHPLVREYAKERLIHKAQTYKTLCEHLAAKAEHLLARGEMNNARNTLRMLGHVRESLGKDEYLELNKDEHFNLISLLRADLYAYRGEFANAYMENYTDSIRRAWYMLLEGKSTYAVEEAQRAFLNISLLSDGVDSHNFVKTHWIAGAATVALAESSHENQALLAEANYHLTEAINACRRINFVAIKPDILLARAKWERLQDNTAQARANAAEALRIADTWEYRLKQADIHNFLAQLALGEGNHDEARRHAEIARERAWCDGPPNCYKSALDEANRLLRETGVSYGVQRGEIRWW